MIIEATSLDASQYTTQYELLRSQVTGTRGDAARPEAAAQPRGVGLALLLRDGMPGWLKAVETVIRASLARRSEDTPESPATTEPPGTYAAAPAWLCVVPHHDLTALLTSLVLSTRRVEGSVPREGYRSWQ